MQLILPAVALNAQYSAVTCSAFRTTTPEQALAYLQRDRNTLEPACIQIALETIEVWRFRPAIKTLYRYLDFEEGPSPVPHMHRPGVTGGRFLAADTLRNFGKSILPQIKLTIRDDVATPLSRTNAAAIYWDLAPEPATIGFIAKAAQEAVDRNGGTALMVMAEKLVPYCLKIVQKEACREALNPSSLPDSAADGPRPER